MENQTYFTLTVTGLKGLDTLGRCSPILFKGDNFCDFLFAFLNNKPFLKKPTLKGKNRFLRSTLKGKNLLPRGANSFLLK